MDKAQPTKYSEQVAKNIIDHLINGKLLRKICSSEDMPDNTTIFRWLATNPEFCDQYRLAKEIQTDMLADNLLDIADKLKPRVYGNKPEPQPTTQQPPALNIIIGEQHKHDLARLTDEQLEQCYQLALANEAKQQI